MAIRGVRRRRGSERGFVLSDHADFPGLVRAVEESHARRVLVTHGSSDSFARFLRERGLDADVLATRFSGESLEAPEPVDEEPTGEPADGTADGPRGPEDATTGAAAGGEEAGGGSPSNGSEAKEPA